MRRAVEAATRAPNVWRIRCSEASMPAALPAPVSTLPSWQYRTSGRTIAFGYRAAIWSV